MNGMLLGIFVIPSKSPWGHVPRGAIFVLKEQTGEVGRAPDLRLCRESGAPRFRIRLSTGIVGGLRGHMFEK